MKLVRSVPDRLEYPLEITQSPERLLPGVTATLRLRVFKPAGREAVRSFETVHEKLIHLFVVGEGLSFFEHIHPVLQPDGSFLQQVRFPHGGMYRLLADFYPAGSVPQLALGTLFVEGACPKTQLRPALEPVAAENVRAHLRAEPEEPIAGLETKLFYSLEPASGLQPYLGAWAHMLAASEDLVDMIHLHPFLADGHATLQFNLMFPRPGLYRIWTQVQRENVVNTITFTVPVRAL